MSNAGPDISGVLAQCRPREKERARESKMATQQTANCRFEGIASLCKGISIKRSNLRKAKLAFYVPVNIHVSINTGYSSSTQSQYLYPRYSSTISNCDLKLKTGAGGKETSLPRTNTKWLRILLDPHLPASQISGGSGP